jgi:hypothetical protein
VYCTDQALINHAWRAGDIPIMAKDATAIKRKSIGLAALLLIILPAVTIV